MKKLFSTLLILALALALSTGAYADTGPKPSVTVNFENLPDEPVAIVAGSETNLKVTTLADMPTAERIAAGILTQRR